VYQQCYCAINTLTQPIKLVGLRICHCLQKITCDLYWQVGLFDSSTLLATRNLYSETTSANMLPVRYTFGTFRAPSLSKLEGHVPLPSVWLRRLCRRRFVYDTWNNGSRLDRVMVECILFMTHCLRLNLQLHTISLVRTCRISSFCTVAWQVARLLLTRRIARSLGDSWASCWFCGMVFGVGQLNYASQIWLKQTLVAMVTKICDF